MKQSWKTLLLLGAATSLFACSTTASGTSTASASSTNASQPIYVRSGSISIACDYEDSVKITVGTKTILEPTQLQVGDKATFTFDIHTDYYLMTFTINDVSKKDSVVNNQYTTTIDSTAFDISIIITKTSSTSATSSNA
jgi:hypothetical protein